MHVHCFDLFNVNCHVENNGNKEKEEDRAAKSEHIV